MPPGPLSPPGSRWPGPRCGPRCAIVCGLLLLLPRPATSLPLRVLARTTLELTTTGDAAGFAVSGRLRDDQGQPLAGRLVELRLGDQQTQRLSDAAGQLAPWLPTVRRGPAQLTASFAGDDQGFAPCNRTLEVQVELPRPALTLQLPAVLPDHEALTVQARVTVHGTPRPGLPLQLRLDEELRGADVSDARGEVTWRLAAEQLAGFGPRTVTVTFPGDADLSAATGRQTFLRQGRPTVQVTARLEEGVLRDSVRIQGRLLVRGEGLPGRRLLLRAGTRPGEAATDERGGFDWRTAREGLDPGLLSYQAVFPGEPGLDEAPGADELQLPPLPTRSVLPQLLTLGLSGLLVVLALSRSRLTRWLWKLGDLRRKRHLAPPSTAPTRARPTVPVRWLDAAPPDGAEPPGPRQLVGEVLSAADGSPIAGAWLTLDPAPGPGGPAPAAAGELAATQSDARGGFRLLLPPAGTCWLTVRAADHVSLRLPLTLPDAGRGSQWLQVSLVPVREAVRALWLDLAASRPRERRPVWGRITPRQLLTRRSSSQKLQLLTPLLEEVWYGRGPHDEESLRRAQEVLAPGGAEEAGGG